MYNKIILIGNLTRDVELRYYVPRGSVSASFGIATSRKYGEKQEVFFGEVIVWGKMAETCNKYISKGSKVLIEGRLTTEQWESHGEKKQKTRIVAENIRFLGSKKAANGYKMHEEIEEIEEPF